MHTVTQQVSTCSQTDDLLAKSPSPGSMDLVPADPSLFTIQPHLSNQKGAPIIGPQEAARLQMYVQKRGNHIFESPTGNLGMSSSQEKKLRMPPKLNLNEVTTAPFLRSSYNKPKTGSVGQQQDSHRKKSPRDY